MDWCVTQADAEHLPLRDKSVDLVFGSPPYCDARTYGIDAKRDCEEWIEWMLLVTRECLRVSKGAVVWVVAGKHDGKRNYWPAPEGLMYRWWADGGSMYRPCYWQRVGIPGSGGDQWFRSDVEYVCCFKRPGRLPWADNVACGHTPKWKPGGAPSHRRADGKRAYDIIGTDGYKNGDTVVKRIEYCPPERVNPGNFLSGITGGGHMGHLLAHENEAPFPEYLAERFVLSLCPPGGIVLDPFSGSGTTVDVTKKHGRVGIGIDIRFNECELGRRRILTPDPGVPIRDAPGQTTLDFQRVPR